MCCTVVRGCRAGVRDGEDDASEVSQSVQPRIKHGMVLPFCPVTLTFRNIHYFVDLPAVSPSRRRRPALPLNFAAFDFCRSASIRRDQNNRE